MHLAQSSFRVMFWVRRRREDCVHSTLLLYTQKYTHIPVCVSVPFTTNVQTIWSRLQRMYRQFGSAMSYFSSVLQLARSATRAVHPTTTVFHRRLLKFAFMYSSTPQQQNKNLDQAGDRYSDVSVLLLWTSLLVYPARPRKKSRQEPMAQHKSLALTNFLQ